jgi:tetratricopeptide (TPR) repeat protein
VRDINHLAYVRANRFYKRGLFHAAAKWFALSLNSWPQDWQALWALGNTFSELKKPAKALSFFSQAINIAPSKELSNLNYNLGNAFFDLGCYQAAINSYRKVSPISKVSVMAVKNIELSAQHLAIQPNPSIKRDALKRAPYVKR